MRNAGIDVGADGVILYQRTYDHERAGQDAGEAHARLVEDDTREEEHEQENIDKADGPGEETVV